MTPEILDPLLTEKELSAWLGLSLPNLQRMRSNGTGPRYVQLSARRIAYRKGDVDAWLIARTTDGIGGLGLQHTRDRPVSAPIERNARAAALT
jgi:predicted DNA-binding transcriptional regulator AlpA